jgi:hypothetical protein
MPGPNGKLGGMSALGGSGLAAAGVIGAVQVDPRRDRLDRRSLYVVIGAGEHLLGGGQFRAQLQRSTRTSRVTSGLARSSRVTPGCPRRPFFVVDVSATLVFCPRDGGTDEFVGVFGGLPARPSSSAMRASARRSSPAAFVLLVEIIDIRQQGQH